MYTIPCYGYWSLGGWQSDPNFGVGDPFFFPLALTFKDSCQVGQPSASTRWKPDWEWNWHREQKPKGGKWGTITVWPTEQPLPEVRPTLGLYSRRNLTDFHLFSSHSKSNFLSVAHLVPTDTPIIQMEMKLKVPSPTSFKKRVCHANEVYRQGWREKCAFTREKSLLALEHHRHHY